PIMAHPPETDSDNTLQEWLKEIVKTNKGIKLDFKSILLGNLKSIKVLVIFCFLFFFLKCNYSTKCVFDRNHICKDFCFFNQMVFVVGYDWMMVKEMAQICSTLSQPVTFPVRAALVRQSLSELCWLLQQSDRYSLTVWTGKQDEYSVEDLLHIREHVDKSRVYYDILEPQNSEFKKAIGI
ncbi:Protein FAM151B, partial [Tinamus guttatus]